MTYPKTEISLSHKHMLTVCVSLFSFLCAARLEAADSAKVKVLEKCEHIDPKLLRVTEAKAKVVTTQDPEHRKVIELVMDYAKAGAVSGLGKDFPGGVNLKKYSAIRFWVRSDVGTSFIFGIGGSYKRKDGRSTSFSLGSVRATETWTQITFPLDKATRGGGRYWDKQKQEPVTVPGGDPMDEEDYAGITRWGLISGIDNRGTATSGHLMFDGFELVEK